MASTKLTTNNSMIVDRCEMVSNRSHRLSGEDGAT
jgi:hypothetical protein